MVIYITYGGVNLTIKTAGKEQVGMLALMTKKLFEDEPSDTVLSIAEFKERLIKYFDNGCKAYLFIEEDVIGYALVNLSRNPYYIVDFFIDRKFRRGGNGTTALNQLITELKTDTIDLDVFCWNERGREFWRSLGFTERAIIMRKHIAAE